MKRFSWKMKLGDTLSQDSPSSKSDILYFLRSAYSLKYPIVRTSPLRGVPQNRNIGILGNSQQFVALTSLTNMGELEVAWVLRSKEDDPEAGL